MAFTHFGKDLAKASQERKQSLSHSKDGDARQAQALILGGKNDSNTPKMAVEETKLVSKCHMTKENSYEV